MVLENIGVQEEKKLLLVEKNLLSLGIAKEKFEKKLQYKSCYNRIEGALFLDNLSLEIRMQMILDALKLHYSSKDIEEITKNWPPEQQKAAKLLATKMKVFPPKNFQPESPTKKEITEKTRQRPLCGHYRTNKRMSILATIAENPNIDRNTIIHYVDISPRGASVALRDLCIQGFLKFAVVSKNKKLWQITPEGLAEVTQYGAERYTCDLKEGFKEKAHSSDTSRQKIIALSSLFEMGRKAYRELICLDTYPRTIQKMIKKLRVSDLLYLIEVAKNMDHIKEKGAYIYAIVFRKASKESRIKGFVKRVLNNLSKDIQDMYYKVAQDLTPKILVELAYSLRKVGNNKKIDNLGPGDVNGILGYILKRQDYATKLKRQNPNFRQKKQNNKTTSKLQKKTLSKSLKNIELEALTC